MERSEALKILEKHLPEKRYVHTLGVLETALTLANGTNLDLKKVELAAIFHDYAKYHPEAEMKELINQHFPKDLLKFDKEIWHGPVGAYLVKTELGIDDPDVFDAIYYHTTGRANMSLLEKIIYVADYIEPGRNFPGVEEARRLANENLDDAVLFAVQNTIRFLVNKGKSIYPDTFHTYNSLLIKKEELSVHEK